MNSTKNSLWQSVYVAFAIEGFPVLILNSMTLLTFALNQNLRKPSTYLLISVSAADALVGLFSMAYGITLWAGHNKGWWNTALNLIWTSAVMASQRGIPLIALERMLATVFPLRHRKLTRVSYNVAISGQWITGSVVAPFYLSRYRYYVFWVDTPIALLGLAVICACYSAIYWKVLNQRKHHKQGSFPCAQKRERKLAKTLFIITVLSLLTCLPDLVYHVVPGFTDYSSTHGVFLVLLLTNSMMNPIVYFWRMRSFRKAMMRIIMRCRGRHDRNTVCVSSSAKRDTQERDRGLRYTENLHLVELCDVDRRKPDGSSLCDRKLRDAGRWCDVDPRDVELNDVKKIDRLNGVGLSGVRIFGRRLEEAGFPRDIEPCDEVLCDSNKHAGGLDYVGLHSVKMRDNRLLCDKDASRGIDPRDIVLHLRSELDTDKIDNILASGDELRDREV
ncbi:adenosine receptor A3-like [Nematostella vectensis]|uniref:adenosine receptor A3-like n=1 Tax=Nematostella vectensis TaxID=45351 RepID=UPI002077022E|nr:adenosine receptor A3-like [Nematostella vectensis]